MIAGLTALSAAFFLGVLGFALGRAAARCLTGAEEMIGSTGEVLIWAADEGRVRVHGEIWAAQSGPCWPRARRCGSPAARASLVGRAERLNR